MSQIHVTHKKTSPLMLPNGVIALVPLVELQRNPLRIALWHKSQGHGSATCSPETRIRTLMPPLAATSISTEAMSPACLGEPSGSHAFPPAIVLTATLALSTAFPFRPVIGTASNYRTYAAR